jgi:hypothetical protein
MFAQLRLSALLGGVLMTVVALPAMAAEPPKAGVAVIADAAVDSAKANPSCASNTGAENSRRCLRLVELPPPPTATAPTKPTAAANAPVAPAAAPARSWLGAVGKRIVAGIVEVAETPYSEGADWRASMSAEIQAKLGQGRPAQQPAPRRLASGS